ncbi:hypothetical protein VIGAN_11105300 [Vigna angularis var. angularis]|uniref:Uncharacterized protein n=1 Tax=Vigna angularis var. angularis TaxID=157739 RepID=A0A0S3T997_PHAAN|nr:hypothetical protein VIGAN_11105300 [Vigna angularis var. angularis]
MKESGELVFNKNNYMKTDQSAPPKRGRGRPPKPKAPVPPGTVVSPSRPRGRPPKDPNAPLEVAGQGEAKEDSSLFEGGVSGHRFQQKAQGVGVVREPESEMGRKKGASPY